MPGGQGCHWCSVRTAEPDSTTGGRWRACWARAFGPLVQFGQSGLTVCAFDLYGKRAGRRRIVTGARQSGGKIARRANSQEGT